MQLTDYRGYPALDGLNSFIHWLEGFISIVEEFISALSGPLLAIGLSFSLVDFLMQGSLLRNTSIALAWAIVQAAAVDAQLVLMWHKSKLAVSTRSWWAFLGFVLLGISLAFVAFGAVALQSLQQSAGLSSRDALASLGLTAQELVYARSAVAIVLACVAGWTRSVTRVEMVPGATMLKQVSQPKSVPTSERENTQDNLLVFYPSLTCTFDEIEATFREECDPETNGNLQVIGVEITTELVAQSTPNSRHIPDEIDANVEQISYTGRCEIVAFDSFMMADNSEENGSQTWEFSAENVAPIQAQSRDEIAAHSGECADEFPTETPTNVRPYVVYDVASEASSQPSGRGRYYITLEEAQQYTGRSENFLKRKINSGEITTNSNGKLRVSSLGKWKMKSA